MITDRMTTLSNSGLKATLLQFLNKTLTVTDHVPVFLVADGDWLRCYSNEAVITKCRVKQNVEGSRFTWTQHDGQLCTQTCSLSNHHWKTVLHMRNWNLLVPSKQVLQVPVPLVNNVWLGGVMVRALYLQLSGRRFDYWPCAFTQQSWENCSQTCASVTKQYNWVLVNRQWCPVAQKVTTRVASHWQYVTDFSGLWPKEGDEQPAYTPHGVWHFSKLACPCWQQLTHSD